jgi:hypothetical protein
MPILSRRPKNLLALNIKLDEAKYPRGSPQSQSFCQEALGCAPDATSPNATNNNNQLCEEL